MRNHVILNPLSCLSAIASTLNLSTQDEKICTGFNPFERRQQTLVLMGIVTGRAHAWQN